MHAMSEGATRIKVYYESTVISDMTSRPSPLIRNLARQMVTRDNIEDVYEVKRSISASFATYEQFAEWLMSEQESAKKSGVKFIAA